MKYLESFFIDSGHEFRSPIPDPFSTLYTGDGEYARTPEEDACASIDVAN